MKEVLVFLDGTAKPLPLEKDDQGVWSATTDPLAPDYYNYSFSVDGVNSFDPSNFATVPNFLYRESSVHVPGPPTLSWETNDVPHGEVHHHFYKSGVVGDDRGFFVYTPPGYDPRGKQSYPVLYLLHGFSDDANAWTAVGRANVILDNLSTHKSRPVHRWLGRHRRVHFHFIPTSSSWLNLVERWFGEITRDRIRLGTFEKVSPPSSPRLTTT